MLSRISMINMGLGVSIIVVALYTVTWHHQSYLLYKEAKKESKNSQKIMALHKQLLTDRSAQISGNKIKDKALNELQMKRPVRNDKQPRKNEWKDIIL